MRDYWLTQEILKGVGFAYVALTLLALALWLANAPASTQNLLVQDASSPYLEQLGATTTAMNDATWGMVA